MGYTDNPSLATLSVMLIAGLGLVIWQLATIVNFRGYRDYHRRLTAWTIGKSDPEPGSAERKRITVMQLIGATIFTLVGSVLIGYAVYGLIQEIVGS